MSDKAFINVSTLTAIGDAIRTKEKSSDLIPTSEMAERILAIQTGGGIQCVADNHCDSDGIWHKPDDWDDIESIDLTDKNECYLLCSTKLTANPFVSIYTYGASTVYWSYGHVVDGEYTMHANSTKTAVSNNKFELDLSTITDDYIVIKIECNAALDRVNTTPNAAGMAGAYNSVLMRYGRMTNCTNLTFSCYYLESDYLIDASKNRWDTTSTITVSSMYNNNYSLQRVVLENFKPEKLKITSFANMFGNCYQLSDIMDPIDMTGWVTSNVTTIANMFMGCFSLKSTLIANNWNLSKVTTMGGLLNNTRSVTKFLGMDTWTAAPLCTNIANFANGAYSLTGTLDFSKAALTNKLNCTLQSCFANTLALDTINFNNCDFSNVSTIGSMCQYSNVKHIYWDTNFIPISTKCTSVGTMFGNTMGIKEVIFDGWNFAGGVGSRTLGNVFGGATNCKKAIFRNCIYPTAYKDDGANASPIYGATRIEYFDMSEFDMSTCTSTYMHSNFAYNCYCLQELYPPQNICKNISFSASPLLSHDSLIRILNNLSTVTGTVTLTLGAINLAKLTDNEKSIATTKGWTLA